MSRSNKTRFQWRITHNKKATRNGRLHDVSNPNWLLNRKTSIWCQVFRGSKEAKLLILLNIYCCDWAQGKEET